MKTDIAFWKNGQSSASWHRLTILILAMMFTLTMNAVDVITDVMLIGAETKEQVDHLRSLGCDVIQGYYYSKPIPMDEFEERYL